MKILILTAALTVLSLAACTNEPAHNSNSSAAPTNPTQPTTIYVETPDDSKASTAGASTTTTTTIRVPASTGTTMGR